MGKLKSWALVAALCQGLGACAVHEPNPNGDFHMLGLHDVSGRMQSMANHLYTLTTLTQRADSQALEQAILDELDTIESIAENLDSDGSITNYSVINRYMGAFIYDVQLARMFASREPANFVPASRLIKSCQSCHESF